MSVDELQNFLVGRGIRLRQILQTSDHKITPPKITEGKLTGYKGMPQNLSGIEQSDERVVLGAQMVDPDRSIDQDHADFDRRRRGNAR
jgi:hypothetical protein